MVNVLILPYCKKDPEKSYFDNVLCILKFGSIVRAPNLQH